MSYPGTVIIQERGEEVSFCHNMAETLLKEEKHFPNHYDQTLCISVRPEDGL